MPWSSKEQTRKSLIYNKITQFENIAAIRCDKFEFYSDRYHLEENIEHFNWTSYDSIREDKRFKTMYEKVKKLKS